MKENIIKIKSFDFAVKIVKLVQQLQNQKEFVLSKQILKSGTSIGANVSEAEYAQSQADFISKMSIALKEASETKYWIELLDATEYIKKDVSEDLKNDVVEIIKILTAIINSSKNNY